MPDRKVESEDRFGLEEVEDTATVAPTSMPGQSQPTVAVVGGTLDEAPLSTTEAVSFGDGSKASPYAFGSPIPVQFDVWGDADGSLWTFIVSSIEDLTGRADVYDLADGEVPAGFFVEMTLDYAGKEPLSMGWNASWEIIGGASNAVPADFCFADDGHFDESAEVFVGGVVSAMVCVSVLEEDIGLGDTLVALNFTGGDRIYFNFGGKVNRLRLEHRTRRYAKDLTFTFHNMERFTSV